MMADLLVMVLACDNTRAFNMSFTGGQIGAGARGQHDHSPPADP